MAIFVETRKRTAILLALLLGFWSWLYTYDKDAWRFWFCLAINLGAFLICLGIVSDARDFTANSPLDMYVCGMYSFANMALAFFIAGTAWVATWLAAVLDAITKPTAIYETCATQSSKIAVFLAILFGPFGFLYTYNKDAVKFWIAIVILVISAIMSPQAVFYFVEGIAYPASIIEYLLALLLSFLYYISPGIHPVVFIVPALLWASAITISIIRYRKRSYDTD